MKSFNYDEMRIDIDRSYTAQQSCLDQIIGHGAEVGHIENCMNKQRKLIELFISRIQELENE